jgi:hypothetical protein
LRESQEYMRARGGVAGAMAQAGQTVHALALLGDAITTVVTIPDNDQRILALIPIAQTLAAAGEHHHLLALIRNHWFQADTTTELLQLLPVVADLVVRDSSLGVALLEAFD